MASPPGCIGWQAVAGDPDQIREDIENQLADLDAELADLDAGVRPNPTCGSPPTRPAPSPTRWNRSSRHRAMPGTMLDRITTALLDDPSDSDLAYRDRQRQLFDDYETLLRSSQSASYHAFTRMIQDPDQRARLSADIDTVTRSLPDMEPVCAR